MRDQEIRTALDRHWAASQRETRLRTPPGRFSLLLRSSLLLPPSQCSAVATRCLRKAGRRKARRLSWSSAV